MAHKGLSAQEGIFVLVTNTEEDKYGRVAVLVVLKEHKNPFKAMAMPTFQLDSRLIILTSNCV